jgi:hypothetical protein
MSSEFLKKLLVLELWFSEFFALKVAAERLALLLRIQEVQGSNLGPETGYPVWVFSMFSLYPPGKIPG